MARRRSNGQGSLYKKVAGGPWIAAWYDNDRKRHERSTRTTDRRAAERILAKHVAEVALRRDGVVDPKADQFARASRRALEEHLKEFHADLMAKGNTKQHARETHELARRVVRYGRVERIHDLMPVRIQAAIQQIRDAGRSLRTCNKALRAIKSFSRWLVRDHRAPVDTLIHLKSYNVDTDRRLERRAVSDDELAYLIAAAECSPQRMGMSGADRAMAYRLAVGTGFRVGELRCLKPSSFDLSGNPPTVALPAGYSKRRRYDVQPIRQDLAERIRSWLDENPDGELLCRLPNHTADMLRADLKAARSTWIEKAGNNVAERERREQSAFLRPYDDAGRSADFHALRHTYITRLVSSGASVKVAQELARHSTPTLTIGRYAHARLHDLSAALDALPDDKTPDDERAELRATGTDDGQSDHQLYPQQRAHETTRNDANACDESSAVQADQVDDTDTQKSLQLATLGDDMRCNSTPSANAGGGTRTHTRFNPERILNPSRLPISPHRLVSPVLLYLLVSSSKVLCKH